MRKPEPVETVHTEVRLLVEAVVMVYAIAVAVMWAGILSHAI